MNNLVEIVNLTKKYGTNVAVNHLTVSLPKGKIIGLLGPNGSGKTTLIKILNGLLTPTEGTILIDGNNVGPATKSKVAYLPDRTYLTMNQTIREILDYFQDFYADFSRERAEEMLKSLGIDPMVKMRTLSKGTKEKVQLILVMSRNASLYILDEPTTGLHFHDISKLLAAFNALIQRGHTIVVVEHNMDIIKCADWIVDLGPEAGTAGGRVVFEGTPRELEKCTESHTGKFLRMRAKIMKNEK